MIRRLLFILLVVFLGCIFSTPPAEANGETPPILMDKGRLPELPRALKKSSAQGVVILKALIDEIGEVKSTDIIKSSGLKTLDTFISNWVLEWRYFPRTDGVAARKGFTTIVIRYDLSTGTFQSPSPGDIPAQVPASVVERVINGAQDRESQVQPMEPLRIKTIPPDIQKLNLEGRVDVLLTIDARGSVSRVKPLQSVHNDAFWKFIETYLEKSRWKLAHPEAMQFPVQIKLPIEFRTALCKIDFLQADIVKNSSVKE